MNNIGPYRKLVPLLQEKWDENCVIITIDDDCIYSNDFIKTMLESDKRYNGKVVISPRSFYLKLHPTSWSISNYHDRVETGCPLVRFPTGVGGVLYRPHFFHKQGKGVLDMTVVTRLKLSMADDVWFWVWRMANGVGCENADITEGHGLPSHKGGLFATNAKDNTRHINTALAYIDQRLPARADAKQFDMKSYWNRRYKSGAHSGAGSYGKLALYKKTFLNAYIRKHKATIQTVADYGCGDGNVTSLLSFDNGIQYYGIDVSPHIVEKCRRKFKAHANMSFVVSDVYGMVNGTSQNISADLVLSMDVLFHLVEYSTWLNYIDVMFQMAKTHVIIFARNHNEKTHCDHVRFRAFTALITKRFPEWELCEHEPHPFPQLIMGRDNSTTSPAEFFAYRRMRGADDHALRTNKTR